MADMPVAGVYRNLRYRLTPANPEAHEVLVELELEADSAAGLRLQWAAWAPGSYMIREFARNLLRIDASGPDGQLLHLRQLDKQTWELQHPPGSLRIRCLLYAHEASVRTSWIDGRRGFLDGASLFPRVLAPVAGPCSVELLAASSGGAADWSLATSMTPVNTNERGFGFYQVADYPELIDHPISLGHFEQADFEVAGCQHRVCVSGRQFGQLRRLCEDLLAVCGEQVAMFGELPISHYLFHLHLVADGYGGLEHRNSTALIASRDDMPVAGMQAPTKGYRRLLGLCSHEYFHLWNVKRIRPREFEQPDLTQETYTRSLWVFEGITSYYDDLMLVRSGVITAEAYLELLAENVSRLLRTPARLRQSLAESSFTAWTKFYRQGENAPDAVVSYYLKGALVALGLDATLRRQSAQRASLDDLMRRLWQHHGKPGIGVDEGTVRVHAEALLGQDLQGFFADFVDGTVELPIADWLGWLGIGCRFRPAKADDDWGGVLPSSPDEAGRTPASLGVRSRQIGDFAELQTVFRGSAAQQAGLAAGDRVVAVDGLACKAAQLNQRVGAMEPGKVLSVHAFRGDELFEFRVELLPAAMDTCDLWMLPDAVESRQKMRQRWLGGRAAVASTKTNDPKDSDEA